jgi:SAM-dependent methyltransferase
VVQAVAPDARVVYADNDPTVLAHARARMASTPDGRTAYVCADMREPDTVLDAPQLRDTLDLAEPVGLTLIATMHFLVEDDEAERVVKQFVGALAPGSYLAASIATDDFAPTARRGQAGVRGVRGDVAVPHEIPRRGVLRRARPRRSRRRAGPQMAARPRRRPDPRRGHRHVRRCGPQVLITLRVPV